ncbi:MAG: winged helix-turn-helix domain-containing protein [Candidatus Dormibacteraceae bacterium]
MKRAQVKRSRPDIDAAVRGGDWTRAMDAVGVPGHATMEQALYWRQIYTEILGMEEKVLKRIRQLMATQSVEEVELTNVPVVVAQAERFRQRLLDLWYSRVWELQGLWIDPEGRMVRHQDRAVALTKREFQLLQFLLDRPYRYFTTSQILGQAWADPALFPDEVLIFSKGPGVSPKVDTEGSRDPNGPRQQARPGLRAGVPTQPTHDPGHRIRTTPRDGTRGQVI